MAQIIWTVLMLLVGGALGFCLGPRWQKSGAVEATPTVIGNVTELADLVVLRVPVSKVHVSRIAGYVGAVDCIVLVNGELELGTDLKLAQWEDVNAELHTATLILAEPVVHRARLDHEHTSVYRIDRRGLWIMVPLEEAYRQVVNRALLEAQSCVETAGAEPELLQRSRQQTERVLGQFFKAVGWEVKCVWPNGQAALNSG